MKKATILFSVIFLMFTTNLTVFSQEPAEQCHVIYLESAPADEQNEIHALESTIRDFLERISGEEGYHFDAKEADFDFQHAYKVYINTNVFTLPSNDSATVKNALESGTYLWHLPIYFDQITFLAVVSRGLPLDPDVIPDLSEEAIEKAKQNEGKWVVNSYTEFSPNLNYISILNEAIANSEYSGQEIEVFLAGGTPNMRFPVGLISDGTSIRSVLALNRAITQYAPQTNQAGRSVPSNEQLIYSFEDVQSELASMPAEHGIGESSTEVFNRIDNGGATQKDGIDPVFIIVAVLLSGSLLTVCCFMIRRKIRKTKDLC